jgi:hypothetical protein
LSKTKQPNKQTTAKKKKNPDVLISSTQKYAGHVWKKRPSLFAVAFTLHLRLWAVIFQYRFYPMQEEGGRAKSVFSFCCTGRFSRNKVQATLFSTASGHHPCTDIAADVSDERSEHEKVRKQHPPRFICSFFRSFSCVCDTSLSLTRTFPSRRTAQPEVKRVCVHVDVSVSLISHYSPYWASPLFECFFPSITLGDRFGADFLES